MMSETTTAEISRNSHTAPLAVPFSRPKGPLGLPTRAQAEEAFAKVGLTVAEFRSDIVLQDVCVVTSCGKMYTYGTFFPEDSESFGLVVD